MTVQSFVNAHLACHHEVTFQRTGHPVVGETVWCPRCQWLRLVLDVFLKQWVLRCCDCPYSQRFGQSEGNALVADAKHTLKTGHYTRLDYSNGKPDNKRLARVGKSVDDSPRLFG